MDIKILLKNRYKIFIDNYFKDISTIYNIPTDDLINLINNSPENSLNKCNYIITKGKNKGKKCQKNINNKNENGFCNLHFKVFNKCFQNIPNNYVNDPSFTSLSNFNILNKELNFKDKIEYNDLPKEVPNPKDGGHKDAGHKEGYKYGQKEGIKESVNKELNTEEKIEEKEESKEWANKEFEKLETKLKKYKENTFINIKTNFIFNEEYKVIGKLEKEEIKELTNEDKILCDKNFWSY